VLAILLMFEGLESASSGRANAGDVTKITMAMN
jgi:hypothetical protein